MPKLTIGGDARGAIKATTDMAAAIKKAGEEGDKTEKRLTKMEKAARRIEEANEPQKRYNRQIKETARLVVNGKIGLEDANRAAVRYGRNLDRAGKAGRNAFASVADQVRGTIAGVLSVTGVIGGLRAELEAVKRESEATTQTQLSVAQAVQNLRQNTFSFSKAERDSLEQGVFGIAQRRGLNAAPLLAAAQANVSGTGDPALTLQLLDVASQFTRDPDAIKDVAGGLGDIAATGGLRDPKDLLGFLTLTQASARIEDTSSVGTQVGKVLAGFTGETVGSDAVTGAAVFSSLTKGIADATGELSRTAAVNLIDRSKKFFEGSGGRGFKPEEIDTFNEQLALLLNDKALATKFVESDSFQFRAATSGGVSKLLLGDPVVRGAFEETKARLLDRDTRVAFAEQALQEVNAGQLQQTSRIEGGIGASAESFRLRKGANLSQEREEELLQLLATATGTAVTQQRLLTFFSSGATFSPEEALDETNIALSRAARFDNPSASQSAAISALEEIRDTLKRELNNRPVTTRAE